LKYKGAAQVNPAANRRAEELIDVYCRACSEPDPVRRAESLARVCADDVAYVDPTIEINGRRALADYIGKVIARYPGGRIERTSALNEHHGMLRFAWQMVLADGKRLPEGIDFAEIGPDGRLSRIAGFFGPLPPK
jgi:hypothetical protein